MLPQADMQPAAPAQAPADPYGRLAIQIGASALVVFVCVAVWATNADGPFWPKWVVLGLATLAAVHGWVVAVRHEVRTEVPGLVLRSGLLAIAGGFCLANWALSGGGYPWYRWVFIGLLAVMGADALYVYRDRLSPQGRARLAERVDTLERTRRGALDVQAEQLRRIERDLHDGAQARLVALSMHLGRAEERLQDRPEEASLVRAARAEASAAIAELRDLARGIAPPVLADRGLAAALESLAQRAAIPVQVSVAPMTRHAPVIETTAYFVVSEALTNVAKHAPGAGARVVVTLEDGRLVTEIIDNGPGGAIVSGNGLTGLRHRVEALDGELRVETGPGGTTIRAELPCVS